MSCCLPHDQTAAAAIDGNRYQGIFLRKIEARSVPRGTLRIPALKQLSMKTVGQTSDEAAAAAR